jgi:hypothetical protein
MNAYLSYWKPEQVHWDDPSSQLLDHAASQQYHKLRADDRVYLLTSDAGKLYLVGRIIVDAVVSQQEAESRLGRGDLWEADYHILAAPGTAMPATVVECEDALRKLYIVSSGQPQQIKEPITAQRFQAMRQISPGSATVLDDLLSSHANT